MPPIWNRLKNRAGGDASSAAPATEESVRWAYRLFLDREPENEEVVRQHCHASTIADVRERFVGSDEFRTKARGFGAPQSTGFEPPLAIESVQDAATMQRLLDHVAAGWSHYGATDPHWSVLTEDRFRKDHLEENLEAFDALGDLHVRRFLATLERNGVALSGSGHCVELGCGVGRLTRWLAPRFARVTGVDVSPGHLELARAHVSRHADNVGYLQLRTLDDLDTLAPIDAFYSFIVLQHNPPPIMAEILERVFARIERGGIAYFQVPTYIPGYRFAVNEYLRHRDGKLDMEMHVLPQPSVFEIAARHGMQPLEALGETVTPVVSHYFLFRKA